MLFPRNNFSLYAVTQLNSPIGTHFVQQLLLHLRTCRRYIHIYSSNRDFCETLFAMVHRVPPFDREKSISTAEEEGTCSTTPLLTNAGGLIPAMLQGAVTCSAEDILKNTSGVPMTWIGRIGDDIQFATIILYYAHSPRKMEQNIGHLLQNQHGTQVLSISLILDNTEELTEQTNCTLLWSTSRCLVDFIELKRKQGFVDHASRCNFNMVALAKPSYDRTEIGKILKFWFPTAPYDHTRSLLDVHCTEHSCMTYTQGVHDNPIQVITTSMGFALPQRHRIQSLWSEKQFSWDTFIDSHFRTDLIIVCQH